MSDGLGPLIGVAVLAPALAAALVAVYGVTTTPATYRERGPVGVTRAALALHLAASIGVALVCALTRHDTVVSVAPWLDEGVLLARVDLPALTLLLLTSALSGVVGRFSATYLHADEGHARFYLLYNLFVAGMTVIALASRLDHLFVGWELVGISSVLLVGFFHSREAPVKNGIRVLAAYRTCDAGMLVAILVLHITHATHTLDFPLAETEHAGALVGAMVLLAASGKAGALPLGGWLPRAMEGPTPSSAVFYGGLSVHAGVFLLIRAHPLLAASPVLTWGASALGLATAVYGFFAGRAQADAKSALAYASMAQIGLMFIEVSQGLEKLALAHMVAHALLRTWQLLRAPSALHDVHGAPERREAFTWLPARVRQRIYAGAVQGWFIDDVIDALVIRPLLAVSAAASAMERAWLGVLAPPDADGKAGDARSTKAVEVRR